MEGQKRINFLSVFVALVVGAVGGCMFALSHSRNSEPHARVPMNTNELVRANLRITELEKALAAAERRAAAKPVPAAGRGAPKAEGHPKGTVLALDGSSPDIFDQLKKQLPKETFGEVTNAIERMRAARQKRVRGKLEFLSSLDTSWMSAKELETHRKLVKLLTRREEIMSKAKGVMLPDMQAMQETAMLGMEMGPLAKDERAALIRQTARTLGFKGDEVDTIHDTINDIFDATGSMGPLGGISEMVEDLGGGGATIAVPQPKVEVKTSFSMDADDLDD